MDEAPWLAGKSISLADLHAAPMGLLEMIAATFFAILTLILRTLGCAKC